jgi:hypothetical protein
MKRSSQKLARRRPRFVSGNGSGTDDKGYRAEWKVRRPLIVRGQRSFADALTDISETLVGRADPETVQNISQQRISEKAA